MPRLQHSVLLATALLSLAAGLSHGAENDALRQDLERVYGRWRSAMITQNYDRWRETTASYRQVITRNAIVSRKELFPKALFKVPLTPPSLDGLRLIKFEEENDTAVSVYYGHVDFNLGVENIPDNLLVLRFLFEDDAWRYDNSRFINLAGAEFVRNDIANENFEFLENEDFAPLGAVPPSGTLCPVPAFAAHLHIVSIGYTTTADINGQHNAEVAQNGRTDIVTGGLIAGENTIKLTVERLDLPEETEKDRRFSVSIYALRRESNKPPVRVFHLAPDQTPPATLETTFIVDPAAIQQQ